MKKAAFFVVAVILLAVGLPAFAQEFPDVPPDHWALRDIRRLYMSGDDLGVTGENFCGDREVTRAEMAVVLYRLRDRFLDELDLALDSSSEE